MNNKTLGLMLIVACIVFGIIIFRYESQLSQNEEASCSCTEMEQGGFCPHEQGTSVQTYLGFGLVAAIFALGMYLIFFEKSQKEIVSALGKEKQLKSQAERFSILLMGLGPEEQKVIKAVKEQDGISQSTLRLRTDLHKSKLSIVLDGLEKKGLVKRMIKGKTKQVFLKVEL